MLSESARKRIIELSEKVAGENDPIRFLELLQKLNALLDESYSASKKPSAYLTATARTQWRHIT